MLLLPTEMFLRLLKNTKKKKKKNQPPLPLHPRNSQTYYKCFPEYIGSNTSTHGESKRTVGCYSVPIVQNTTQEKSVCVCVRGYVCVRARYFQQLVCIYEVAHMLGLDILVLGPLKDKAVWGSAKAKFSLQVPLNTAKREEINDPIT